jgi:glycosyltransferase involved in cell wall biosynthesis
MYKDKQIVVVMPAYNAAKTLRKTYDEVMEQGVVDLVILVDDASCDQTSAIASGLPRTQVFVHERNKGYGGNQKTCYRMALEAGADSGDGRHDRKRSLSLRSRIEDTWRIRAEGGAG